MSFLRLLSGVKEEKDQVLFMTLAGSSSSASHTSHASHVISQSKASVVTW